MTDDPDASPDLSPEREREVRRLLADARHTEPVPGDVAARLDRVLAELARSGPDAHTPVTVLASRRRQRVTSLLVAAAAVVAIGVGLGQVVGTSSDEDAGSADTAMSSEGGDAPEAAAKPRSGREDDGNDALSGTAAAPEYAVAEPRRIRPERFSRDVMRVRQLTERATPAELQPQDGGAPTFGAFQCTPAEWGAGTFVPVTYGGDHGVLVFRRPDGDTQVVDLFQCGSADVLRSITLPAP